jgi:hypothetical protein
MARARCGSRAADAAWAVVFSVPLAAMAENSVVVVFVVRTPTGLATF